MFARGRNPEDNPNNLPDSREETPSLREFPFLREMLRSLVFSCFGYFVLLQYFR